MKLPPPITSSSISSRSQGALVENVGQYLSENHVIITEGVNFEEDPKIRTDGYIHLSDLRFRGYDDSECCSPDRGSRNSKPVPLEIVVFQLPPECEGVHIWIDTDNNSGNDITYGGPIEDILGHCHMSNFGIGDLSNGSMWDKGDGESGFFCDAGSEHLAINEEKFTGQMVSVDIPVGADKLNMNLLPLSFDKTYSPNGAAVGRYVALVAYCARNVKSSVDVFGDIRFEPFEDDARAETKHVPENEEGTPLPKKEAESIHHVSDVLGGSPFEPFEEVEAKTNHAPGFLGVCFALLVVVSVVRRHLWRASARHESGGDEEDNGYELVGPNDLIGETVVVQTKEENTPT